VLIIQRRKLSLSKYLIHQDGTKLKTKTTKNCSNIKLKTIKHKAIKKIKSTPHRKSPDHPAPSPPQNLACPQAMQHRPINHPWNQQAAAEKAAG